LTFFNIYVKILNVGPKYKIRGQIIGGKMFQGLWWIWIIVAVIYIFAAVLKKDPPEGYRLR